MSLEHLPNCNLIHGDCYEIIPTLEDKSIDLIVCDPPYQFEAIRGSGMYSEKNFEKYGRSRSIDTLKSLKKLDSVIFEPSKMLDLLLPKLKVFYGYFFCNSKLVADYINWAREHKFSYDILIEYKQNPVPAHSTHHCSDLEYIVLIRDKGTYFKGKGLEFDDYRKWYSTICKKRIHPAEKPVELLERFVRVSCPEGGTILDCFMGSGSTGIAAIQNNCNFIGIEKDDTYFELASKRMQDRVDELNGVGTLFEGLI